MRRDRLRYPVSKETFCSNCAINSNISLIPMAYKLYSTREEQTRKKQIKFRPNRGCFYQISTLRQFSRYCHDFQVPTIIRFSEIRGPSDSIDATCCDIVRWETICPRYASILRVIPLYIKSGWSSRPPFVTTPRFQWARPKRISRISCRRPSVAGISQVDQASST